MVNTSQKAIQISQQTPYSAETVQFLLTVLRDEQLVQEVLRMTPAIGIPLATLVQTIATQRNKEEAAQTVAYNLQQLGKIAKHTPTLAINNRAARRKAQRG